MSESIPISARAVGATALALLLFAGCTHSGTVDDLRLSPGSRREAALGTGSALVLEGFVDVTAQRVWSTAAYREALVEALEAANILEITSSVADYDLSVDLVQVDRVAGSRQTRANVCSDWVLRTADGAVAYQSFVVTSFGIPTSYSDRELEFLPLTAARVNLSTGIDRLRSFDPNVDPRPLLLVQLEPGAEAGELVQRWERVLEATVAGRLYEATAVGAVASARYASEPDPDYVLTLRLEQLRDVGRDRPPLVGAISGRAEVTAGYRLVRSSDQEELLADSMNASSVLGFAWQDGGAAVTSTVMREVAGALADAVAARITAEKESRLD